MTNSSYLDRLTDEALRDLIAANPDTVSRGERNAAPYLLKLPFEHRPRAIRIGHLYQSYGPGWTYSTAIAQAMVDILAMIETGHIESEHRLERYCREDIERDQAARKEVLKAEAAAAIRWAERRRLA